MKNTCKIIYIGFDYCMNVCNFFFYCNLIIIQSIENCINMVISYSLQSNRNLIKSKSLRNSLSFCLKITQNASNFHWWFTVRQEYSISLIWRLLKINSSSSEWTSGLGPGFFCARSMEYMQETDIKLHRNLQSLNKKSIWSPVKYWVSGSIPK